MIRKKLEELRKRPYREKMKILWLGVGIAFIILMIIWLITIRFRNIEGTASSTKFEEIFNNLKKLREIKWQ